MQSVDVSVILATRNRARRLENTLTHLAGQELAGHGWEVLVVDNGSTDDTAAVLARPATTLPLIALREPMPGKNRALNRALGVARGRLLLFTDDDVIPSGNWVREMHEAAQRWPAASIFGGRVVLALPDEAPGWLRAFRTRSYGLPEFDPPLAEGPTELLPFGPNFAVRREAVRTIRYCETVGPGTGKRFAMGSETELLRRLQAVGHKVVYVPSAVVQHVLEPHQLTERYLLGRSFRLGRGEVRVRHQHRHGAVRLWGVPRYLWRMLGAAALRYTLALPAGSRRRLDAGFDLCFTAGCILENWLLRRESGSSANVAPANGGAEPEVGP